MTVSDDALWKAARRDPDAFGVLWERHARAVLGFCLARTGDRGRAEDLTSTVFLEAWRRRRSVELTNASALPFLLGVANNVTRNADRSLHRYRAALSRLAPAAAAPAGPEDDIVDRIDSQRAFDDAIRALTVLSQGERDAFALVAWSGLTYEEAATALGVELGAVRSRLWRARQKLQLALAAAPSGSYKPAPQRSV
ncbi:MAG TPA: RNA polymerase sigma factor [Acidimicrobiales bacterium]|nr:RNA polymerase sigma factor [Acidimicrobiales bacterium]